ncbi:MAG: flagellar export protein FliJ [Chromatiales bacterium]|jgi:flagellar FliJ protein|nr:flagellar export protein FliJ [Chromatiales bacterium]
MSRPDRLESLERLASFDENEAARRLAAGLQRITAEEERLRQLCAYLDEYANRGSQAGGALATAALVDGRRFVARLRDAVVQQEGALARARADADQLAAAWRASRARRLAYTRLRERALREIRTRRDRQEQRLQDEIAQGRSGPG